jgi:hypothetical protein
MTEQNRKRRTARRADDHRLSMKRWEKLMSDGLTSIAQNFAEMVGRLTAGKDAARRIEEFNAAILELQRANETLMRLHGPGPSRQRAGTGSFVTLKVPVVVGVPAPGRTSASRGSSVRRDMKRKKRTA